MPNYKELITASLNKLEKWIEDHSYKGYDPAEAVDIRQYFP
jgi:hypothetical protein